MLDREIVHALAARSTEGLTRAYGRFAALLHDYCLTLTEDAEAAADAVHDTFVIAAERASRLDDPDALRPWLYAIARSRCLPRPPEEEPFLPPGAGAAPGAPGPREEPLRVLASVLAALPPSAREIADLSLRHGLRPEELARALNLTPLRADQAVAEVRVRMERGLDTALAEGRPGHPCMELHRLGNAGGALPLRRNRIAAHRRRCAPSREERTCALSRSGMRAAVPIRPAPPGLGEQIAASLNDPALTAHHTEFAAAADPYRTGRAAPEPRPRPLRSGARAAAALSVPVLLLGALVLLSGSGELADTGRFGPPAAVTEGSAPPMASIEGTGGAGRFGLEQVIGQDATAPDCVESWDLSIAVTTHGGVDTVTVRWALDGDPAEGQVPLAAGPQEDTWYTLLEELPPGTPVLWSVTVAGSDGSVHHSIERRTERGECPPATPFQAPH